MSLAESTLYHPSLCPLCANGMASASAPRRESKINLIRSLPLFGTARVRSNCAGSPAGRLLEHDTSNRAYLRQTPLQGAVCPYHTKHPTADEPKSTISWPLQPVSFLLIISQN